MWTGPNCGRATRDGVRKILHDPYEPEAAYTVKPSPPGPEGVLVLVNGSSADSQAVAEYYRTLRKIPKENILTLNCPQTESVDRQDFVTTIRNPLRRYLLEGERSRRISFIVTTMGIPLRIKASPMGGAQTADAAVDSELTLVMSAHPVRGVLPNPYLHREERFDSTRFAFYPVCRLDGPSRAAVLNLIRKSTVVEEQRSYGSRGFTRLDLYPDESDAGAALNRAILCNYQILRRQNRLSGRIGLPERTELTFYRKGSCYNTFFFMGWGVREYRPDVFSWVQGAVGRIPGSGRGGYVAQRRPIMGGGRH